MNTAHITDRSDPVHSFPDGLRAVLEQAARRDPDALCLVGLADTLTRANLLRRVMAVATDVAARVRRGGTVAAVVPHAPGGLVAILGCVVAGRLCCVLNQSDPPERRADILTGARPDAILVVSDAAIEFLTLPDGVTVLHVGAACAGMGAPAGGALLPDATDPDATDPDGPAMVHYTSGSTGRPKGIVVSLRSAFVRAASFLDDWAMDASDRLLAVTPPSAGSGLAFVIAALLSGARLLVVSLAADGAAAVLRLARREAVTIVVAGPSLTGMLLRLDAGGGAFARLRMLRVGAAGIRAQELAGWRVLLPPDCAVSHTYASTEAMIIASWTIPAGYAGAEPYLPVGRILTRVACRLVDEDGAAVAVGEVGEMVVSGRDLALGEWREGRLVAGRMEPDPARPGWRVFRTGDLMRLGADGLLRFVCRADRQIKINGVRIEPGEIEAVLRREPGVVDAVVAGRTIDGRMVLEAFVAAPDCDAAALRRTLQARLRDALVPAMRPSRLVVLAALARLPGGKVDLVGMRRVADAGTADGGAADG